MEKLTYDHGTHNIIIRPKYFTVVVFIADNAQYTVHEIGVAHWDGVALLGRITRCTKKEE